MPKFVIRECRASDLPAVNVLLHQLAEVTAPASDFQPAVIEAIWRDMAARPEVYLNLVAEAAGQVVGFASVVFYKTLYHRGGTALINELVVLREQRGQGIGRALVERVVVEAGLRGMDEVEVGTERSNTDAQRFYRANGFDQEYVQFGMELT